MASEKQLKNRIKSTNNIRKITKSMKMVSAAKMRGQQQRMVASLPFIQWSDTLYGGTKDVDVEGEAIAASAGEKTLLVCLSTDRGLCGSVNSQITRVVGRFVPRMDTAGKQFRMVVLGEKGRGQLKRRFGGKLDLALTDYTKGSNSFANACALSEEILKTQDVSNVFILFNKFINTLTTIPHIRNIKTEDYDADDEPFENYEFDPEPKEEFLQDMYEFHLASSLHCAILQSATSEQSTRLSAMENATKNAGEMIEMLKLKYNRARQSRITTELIEIISGASALEESK